MRYGLLPEYWESRAYGDGSYLFFTLSTYSIDSTATDGFNNILRGVKRLRTEVGGTVPNVASKSVCLSLDSLSADMGPTESFDTPAPTPSQDGYNVDKPYKGDWALASWNTQGLMAAKTFLQMAKRNKASSLASKKDILVMQETHGNLGKCRGFRNKVGYKAFWSNGPEGADGVGAWVKEEFLVKICNGGGGFEWLEVVPGSAAILRCWGSLGRIQIGIVYLPTGSSGGKDDRQHIILKITSKMKDWKDALQILVGDFNFVVNPRDRYSGDPPSFSGDNDKAEAKQFDKVLLSLGLRELYQPEPTYRNSKDCRSRLDRVYTNIDTYEWLDREIGIVALDWDDKHSRHRAISAFRKSADIKAPGDIALQAEDIGGDDWSKRVKLEYLARLRNDGGCSSAIKRLLHLKDSIKQVTLQVNKDRGNTPAVLNPAGRLSYAMRYIRAIEQGSWHKAHLARLAFPEISARVGNICDKRVLQSRWVAPFHVWILDLARIGVTAEIDMVKQLQVNGDDTAATRKKENIIRQLKRMAATSDGGIQAIKGSDGRIHTDTDGMISVLESHWSKVFRGEGVNLDLLKKWLRDMYPGGNCSGNSHSGTHDEASGVPTINGSSHPGGTPGRWNSHLPKPDDDRWKVRKKDLSKAIRGSKNSSPGPDGIPYLAWRELGDTGLNTLWDAMKELEEDDAPERMNKAYGGSHEFNMGWMVCLPKVATEIGADGTEIFDAASTRPLSIVNTDNRLMCSAARLCWDHIFNGWVSKMQKGFLKGRSMLSNVLTIDHEAMRVSLQCDTGAIILFDFKAAFPSIDRDFMLHSLEWLGMPSKQLNFIRAMYDKTLGRMKTPGGMGQPFGMSRGIRQGCPLSPLIFAVVVDILLRKIGAFLEDRGLTRAFADDTAAVVSNFFDDFPRIATIFGEYGEISGLHLNYSKTIIVPLWMERELDYGLIKDTLDRSGGSWREVLIQSKAKYLGFLVGPGRDDSIWDKPCRKWIQRATAWAKAGCGLQYSAMVYNVFCASVLSFLAQLLIPPSSILDNEGNTMRIVAKGPTLWAIDTDLWQMGSSCSIGRSFHCVKSRAEAAKLRAMHFENWESPIPLEVGRLIRWRAGSNQNDRKVMWETWYGKSYPRVLNENMDLLRRRGTTLESVSSVVNKGLDREEDALKLRAVFQTIVSSNNLPFHLATWAPRVEHKLRRWGIAGLRRIYVATFIKNSASLGKMVAPRVAAATWSLAWNRWCTARRFQKTATCVLGCGNGDDSAEHYFGCRVGRVAGHKHLRLHDVDYPTRKASMLGARKFQNEEEQARWAILVYGIFMATNRARGSPLEPRCDSDAVEEVSQFMRRATEGHTKSQALVGRLWSTR
jgi:exonuclease III